MDWGTGIVTPPGEQASGASGDVVDVPCDFGALSAFHLFEHGGSDTGRGSVTTDPTDGDFVLSEGDSFLVGFDKTFQLSAHPGTLQFDIDETHFDNSRPGTIRDAFEVALVGPNGVT